MVLFPELAKLMAAYGLNKKGLSRIIKKSPAAVSYKLSGKVEFKLGEIQTITSFFQSKDPTLSSDFIFSQVGD